MIFKSLVLPFSLILQFVYYQEGPCFCRQSLNAVLKSVTYTAPLRHILHLWHATTHHYLAKARLKAKKESLSICICISSFKARMPWNQLLQIISHGMYSRTTRSIVPTSKSQMLSHKKPPSTLNDEENPG